MNIARGDDEDRELGDIGERVDLVAATDAQSAASEEEKGNISAERGSDFEQARQREIAPGQAEIAEKGGGGADGNKAVALNNSSSYSG